MRRTFAMLVLAVAVALVPASFANTISFWFSPTNAPGSWVSVAAVCNGAGTACQTAPSTTLPNGVTVDFWTSTSNAPGGTSTSFSTEDQNSLNNATGSTKDFYLAVIASTFTMPTGPGTLAGQDTAIGTTGGAFSLQNTGLYNAAITGGTLTSDCSAAASAVTTATSPNNTSESKSLCTAVSPYTLGNVTHISLADATTLHSDESATFTVPEPASMMLFGTGLIGLAGALRRKLGR